MHIKIVNIELNLWSYLCKQCGYVVQLERIWYLRYRKLLCFTLRIIAAILPPVTEHLDWMETDTGCGRHRETVHYIRRGSYLEVGNGALRYSRFFVRREQRPIGKCTRLLISLKVISEIMCGHVTVDVVSSVLKKTSNYLVPSIL